MIWRDIKDCWSPRNIPVLAKVYVNGYGEAKYQVIYWTLRDNQDVWRIVSLEDCEPGITTYKFSSVNILAWAIIPECPFIDKE